MDASRADFFKDNVLSSVRGYRALVQGRIPRDQLMDQAPWKRDITPIISSFVTDMSNDPGTLTSGLGKYDLVSEEDRPAPSYRREGEAREQLALDLTLSATIYSHEFNDTHLVGDDDELDAMSRATEAMSLENAEPPPVTFGFFRPESIEANNLDVSDPTPDANTSSVASMIPLGVRLLLDDWKLGSSPHDYAYEDPYGIADQPTAIQEAARPRAAQQTTPTSALPPVVQTVRPATMGRPPTVASSQPVRSLPTLPSSQPQELRRDVTAGSQPNGPSAEPSLASQIPFSSTQVLPGPHGGRPPPIMKKKPIKKRVGGF